MAQIAGWVWIAVQCLIGYNLALPLLLFVLYKMSYRPRSIGAVDKPEADYAIIVTAYQFTQTLPAVVDSILKLNYNNYLVYIVADKCDISDLHFSDDRIIVLRPEETLGSNTRSHFYAIHRFKRAHEQLTIIDSDNLVDPEYLNELNVLFDQGFEAVQGLRKAKNMDTMVACLDAARDLYYHFYDGDILFQLGSSATLAGSGMAFTTTLYRTCLEHLDITGAGFDKVLQREIVSRGYRIAFTDKAIVYDEKTSGSDQLVKQRARWINTWFRYFKFGFGLIASGILKFDINRFLFGFILLRPPLFIFLLLSAIFLVTDAILVQQISQWLWLSGFGCFIAGFFIALVHGKADPAIYRSLRGIPKFIFYQIQSLLKSKKANQISVATRHFHDNKIDEVKKQD